MDEREHKLPAWAQALIKELRQRAEFGREPLIKELAELRPKVGELKARNDALKELLQMAAKGGHIGATDIINVIEEYATWKY